MKDPDTTPLDTPHVDPLEMSPVGDEEIVQLVSPPAKFDPETVTLVPTGPEEGDRDIVAGMAGRPANLALQGVGLHSTPGKPPVTQATPE